MKREFLKGLGLEEDAINQIMAEHGKTIASTQAEVETLTNDKATLQTQLAERDNDFEELKKSANLSEEQTKEFEALQTKYNEDKDKWAKELEENKQRAYIQSVVLRANPKDEVSVNAHINEFVKDKEFKDGSIEGLEAFVTKLQTEKDYLFGEKPQGTGAGGNKPQKPELTLGDEIKGALFGEDK